MPLLESILVHADFLICPRWVVPVEPMGAVLERHAVAVGGGRILAVLPRELAQARYSAASVIERPDHVLMPGLVNAHTHAAMTLLRGYADDLPLERWLADHIWPAEGRWLSEEFVRDGAELAMLEMLRGGTTCFMDMYLFPEPVAGLAVEHRLRAVLGLVVIDQPTPWARTRDEYFAKGLALHDQYRGHPLVSTAFGPHAPYSVGDATLSHLRLLANELDVAVHMHVHETAAEVTDGIAQYGERPLARLDRLKLLSAQFMAVHATALDAADIALLAERRASVVHCPSSNQKLASGTAPVSALMAAGVNVALGTDGAASNNRLDMFTEMRAAALQAKVAGRDAAALPAAAALAMATLTGARALGLADRIGSIEAGKEADLICVDLSDAATQPVHHVISQLVYAAGAHQVSDAWIAGEHRLVGKVAQGFDTTAIIARASAWQGRMAAP